MRKIIFTFLLLCTVLFVRAGSYYSGTTQLYNLLMAVDESFSINNDSKGVVVPITAADGEPDTSNDWYVLPGVCFFTRSGECGIKPTPLDHSHAGPDDDAIQLPYHDGSQYTYWVLQSIDWSNKGYHPRPGYPFELIQYPDPPEDDSGGGTIGDAAQGGELRWLQSLNFSGNYFTSFAINGQGILDQLALIDFSNNPTLQSLSIQGCPNPDLKVIISRNGFSFGKLWQFFEASGMLDNTDQIVPWLEYGDQGLVKRAFPADRIDLADDADGFSTPTTYAFTDLEGNPITPTVLSPGVFSIPASYDGQQVYCNAKCGYFSKLPDGITFLITVTDDVQMLSEVDIAPKSPDAYEKEPVALKVLTTDFQGNSAGNVSFKWESADGTFDNEASATPNFTPSKSGNVDVKCTATQTRAGKTDVVVAQTNEFYVNPARIISSIEVNFKFEVYLTGEDAPFTINTIDQYGPHTGMTNGIQITASEGILDVDNRTFTSFDPGTSAITFDAGTTSKTIYLLIVDNSPIDAMDADASSSKMAEGDDIVDHTPDLLIDGSRDTRWAAAQYDGVTFNQDNKADFPEWVTVDLGAVYNVYMIDIDWEISRAAVWDLYVSEDGEDWSQHWLSANDANDLSVVDMGGDHYISRVYGGDTNVRYIKVDCKERNAGYLGQYAWNYSMWEIVAYGSDLTGMKTIKPQSGAYYNQKDEFIVTGEGKSLTNIYSLTGQKVLSGTTPSINVSSLSKGCYIARIINENGTVTAVKFVK